MILFDKTIFGPVQSRRLGISLGVNLLPNNRKFCNFDCVYCECGLSNKKPGGEFDLPSREKVNSLLVEKLDEMKARHSKLDAITFAGNGEPTMHPQFEGIIDDTIKARDLHYPGAIVSVLSNATMLHKESVFHALLKVDKNILKLDSAIEGTVTKLNAPGPGFSLNKTIDNLKKFNGNFILQTMFTRGTIKGTVIDNTLPGEISSWLELINELNPKQVMIYTIQRAAPFDSLEIIAQEELEAIGAKVRALGIDLVVAI